MFTSKELTTVGREKSFVALNKLQRHDVVQIAKSCGVDYNALSRRKFYIVEQILNKLFDIQLNNHSKNLMPYQSSLISKIKDPVRLTYPHGDGELHIMVEDNRDYDVKITAFFAKKHNQTETRLQILRRFAHEILSSNQFINNER